MTINLLDRRNRDTDLAALTSRHNANLSLFLALPALCLATPSISPRGDGGKAGEAFGAHHRLHR